ncbi:MAG: hypothetical protein PHI63_04455 [Patescibacteria group bacterium]|nr:hypothetical protein [Patescibacteria group bacterium]
MPIGRILLGLAMVAIGGVITVYANKFYEALGPMAWAEEHLGTEGGTRLMYKLIGIGLCVIGFMVMTNMLTDLLVGLVRTLFPQMIKAPAA